MKKYTYFKFDHCYITREGDFAVALLDGDIKHGYLFAATHAHPSLWGRTLQLKSRVIPNDGHWIEIDVDTFNVVAEIHLYGHKAKISLKKGDLPVISEY